MAVAKTKFRTLQDEYFMPEDPQAEDLAPESSNWKLIIVVGLGFLAAASLATLLSVAI